MIRELKRILSNKIYWLIILGGLSFRGVLMYNDRKYRTDMFFASCSDFWKYIGSLTQAIVILYSVIYIFSYDREKGASPVICSTRNGRLSLFLARLSGGAVAVCISTVLMALVNVIMSQIFGEGLIVTQWIPSFVLKSLIAAGGALGLYITSACICDVSQNHTFTMAVCAVPYLLGYLRGLSGDAILDEFGLWWFLRYEFFTDFMRGQTISSRPLFWTGWYTALILGMLFLALYKRKMRYEL